MAIGSDKPPRTGLQERKDSKEMARKKREDQTIEEEKVGRVLGGLVRGNRRGFL